MPEARPDGMAMTAHAAGEHRGGAIGLLWGFAYLRKEGRGLQWRLPS
jgi:hypothetical protein